MISCPGCGDIKRTRAAMNEHIAEFHPGIAPLDTAPDGELWVPGWLTQLMLLAFAAAAVWLNRSDAAVTFAVGSSIVGAVRQIERDRRRSGRG